jgi:type II secretory pathway pseudopilin PulG
MKPVNLLPESYRPRRPTGEGAGDSRFLIGLLAVLLVMAVAYAIAANQVNSRTSDIAAAKAATQRAEAQSAAQSSYGGFHEMKQTRVASVLGLATGRFDWERLMRETAFVLPHGTWILDMTSSSTNDPSKTTGGSTSTPPSTSSSSSSSPSTSSSSSSTSSTSGAAGGSTTAASPATHIFGCALHQNDVAVLLVRLRKLHRATDVDLTDSTKEDQTGGTSTSSSSTAGADNCGDRRFKFDVTVTFAPPKPEDLKGGGNVPVSLGGGS